MLGEIKKLERFLAAEADKVLGANLEETSEAKIETGNSLVNY